MIKPDKDQQLMRHAVDLSKDSQGENDGRIHPKVGAVIVRPNGDIISSGFRGQYTPGNHAEQEALEGIEDDVLAGAIVYSTLEPCTFRGKQTPCCLRLIDRRIAEVVIGILDPNPDIRGRGWWKFEEQGVKVRNFDPEFVREIRELNREFIDYQLGVGLTIRAVKPEGAAEIEVDERHRARGRSIEVRRGRISVTGTYRVRPSPGDRITMLVRFGNLYFPQAPIDFSFDRENSMWLCPSVYLGWPGMDSQNDYEIIVARTSEDLDVSVGHYYAVHEWVRLNHKIEAWVGIEMKQPPGLERLVSLTAKVSP